MWPFRKKSPAAPRPQWIEEPIILETHDIKSSDPYEIQVGLGYYDDRPDRFRVYFKLSSPGFSNLTIIPRQHPLERERALVLANKWAAVLRATYDLSLEQIACDL